MELSFPKPIKPYDWRNVLHSINESDHPEKMNRLWLAALLLARELETRVNPDDYLFTHASLRELWEKLGVA